MKKENYYNNKVAKALQSVFTERFFNAINKSMILSDYDRLDIFLDQPFDVLEAALRSCKTTNEAINTKLTFIVYLLKLDTEIARGDCRCEGLSYFLDCKCSEIVVVFSDIVTYISHNSNITWREGDDDEWDLSVSGDGKDLFCFLDDALEDAFNKKRTVFRNSINLDGKISDIWFGFLNDAS